MKYSIIIPTYNHCTDLLKPCLEAIFKYSIVSDLEIIVSANGCTDDTFGYLGSVKEKFSYLGLSENFKYVWNKDALGYAKATNAGIQLATTNRIVLFNNDAFLSDQVKNGWVDILNSAFKNHKCGISAVLLRPSEITKRDFAVFMCVMIGREVFDKIGLLSEDYGSGGCEDIEFCLLAEKAGFKIYQPMKMVWSDADMLHIGDFPLYHRGEATVHDLSLVPDYQQTFHQNELTLAKKFNPEWYEAHKNDAIMNVGNLMAAAIPQ